MHYKKRKERNAWLAPLYNEHLLRKFKLGKDIYEGIRDVLIENTFEKLFGGPKDTIIITIGDFEQQYQHRKHKDSVKEGGFRISCRCSKYDDGECKTFIRGARTPGQTCRTDSSLRQGLVEYRTCSRRAAE